MPDAPLRFRPHHFLCALGFAGKGYSDVFTANLVHIVVDRLRAEGGDQTLVEVVDAADDICAPCPKRRGLLCETQDRIVTLDARHALALGLCAGDRLTWGAAQVRMKSSVPPGSLATLCAGCQWLDLGLCEAALLRLHSDEERDASF
ncbi:hypothetical protein SAMN05443999_112105 [Roseovarius azorensis]|uniref:DUF1284 domain-containing protein n=1 Tax=Roseovarius azorensis TaxID=1287727 RepID=A0A1H7VJN0_9RHOB|nr:DUF1284 domain-containing protein [Roseovarius azorensis]SEM09055.1 hypothetical protein SAMN05443999_112105 [Roseovarius azorensis]